MRVPVLCCLSLLLATPVLAQEAPPQPRQSQARPPAFQREYIECQNRIMSYIAELDRVTQDLQQCQAATKQPEEKKSKTPAAASQEK